MSKPSPLVSLQYLRGIAAVMVVVVHLHTQIERMGYSGSWPAWLAGGVDIFFVLSGYLMWSTTVGRAQSPGEFWRRRIVRIVPLYWLLTTFAVAVMLVAPQAMQSVRFDWLNVIGSYLFVFTPGSDGRLDPVLVVGWTLNYEMFFYLLYGLALALPVGWRFGATAGAIVALVATGVALDAAGGQAGWLAQRYTSPIMLEFVFGMAVARWWAGLPAGRPGGWLGAALVLLGFAGIALPWADAAVGRGISTGLPAALVVAGGLLVERAGMLPRIPGLQATGDMSYSLYLSHPIVLSAFSQLWRKAGLHLLPAGVWLFCAAALAVCLIAGVLVYRWIEQPLARRWGATTGARPAVQLPAGARAVANMSKPQKFN